MSSGGLGCGFSRGGAPTVGFSVSGFVDCEGGRESTREGYVLDLMLWFVQGVRAVSLPTGSWRVLLLCRFSIGLAFAAIHCVFEFLGIVTFNTESLFSAVLIPTTRLGAF